MTTGVSIIYILDKNIPDPKSVFLEADTLGPLAQKQTLTGIKNLDFS